MHEFFQSVFPNSRYIVSTESGNVLIWNVRAEAVVFKAEQKNVQQLLLLDDDTKFVTVSKVGLVRVLGEGWTRPTAYCLLRRYPPCIVSYMYPLQFIIFSSLILYNLYPMCGTEFIRMA